MSPAAALPLDTLAQQLTALGMEHAETALPELIETAAREHLDPSAFLGRVLTRQLERKDERRIATMLTLSGLPSGKTLETFGRASSPRPIGGSSRRSPPARLSASGRTSCFSDRPVSERATSPVAWVSRRSRTASR